MNGLDIRSLKASLQGNAERLVVALLGEPTAKGQRYWRWGRKGSLSYDFQRHHWHSFEDDEGGDLLDLIRFVNPGWDFRDALDFARNWVGSPMTPAPRPAPSPAPRPATERDPLGTADLALQLWKEARRAEGTIVETYLKQRGLVLPNNCIEVLRFHPACPRSGDRLPALLGLMRDIETDEPVGIHRTFLRADGLAKAAVEPNKMMLGPSRGTVLKLAPDEDVTLGLAITEGIEDGLAVLADGIAPVWACLSAGAMLTFPQLNRVEALTIYCDNDAPGASAAEACAERWRRRGKEARVVEPPRRFKDFGEIAEERRHHQRRRLARRQRQR